MSVGEDPDAPDSTRADGQGRGEAAGSIAVHLPKLRLNGRDLDHRRPFDSTFREKGIRADAGNRVQRPGHADESPMSTSHHTSSPSLSPTSPSSSSKGQSLTSKIVSRVRELKTLFELDVDDEDEELVDTFLCALKKRILLQGRMYIFTKHVCFSSSLFGYHKLKTIPIRSLLSVRKMKHVGFPNSVELVWQEREDSVKKEFFTSFLSREEAFKTILRLWDGGRAARLSQESQESDQSGQMGSSTHSETPSSSTDDATGGVVVADTDVTQGRSPHSATKSEGRMEPLLAQLGQVSHGMLLEPMDRTQSAGEILTPRGAVEHDDIFSPSNELENPFGGRPDDADDAYDNSLEQPPGVPDIMQKVMEYTIHVHPKEFYDLFLSSKSDFFIDFHAAQGHKNIELSAWDYHGPMGPVRDLSFVTALKGFRIGPPEALCHQTQRVGVYAGSHIVFETSQVMNDIPYGDHFKVETRWDIFPEVPVAGSAENDPKQISSKMVIHIAVPFTKNTMFKKFIEKGVTDSLLEAYQMFKQLAAQKLEEQEQADHDDASVDGRSSKSSRSERETPVTGSKPAHPEDLLPQEEADWEMILERVEPKFRTGLACLRKMQQEVARQNKFSLTKSKHRRNTSIIDSVVLDAIMSDCEDANRTDEDKEAAEAVEAVGSRLRWPASSFFDSRDRVYVSVIVVLLAIVCAQSVLLHIVSGQSHD